MIVTLCTGCPLGRAGFAATLRAALHGIAAVAETDCMSGCTRPSALAVRAPGKTAYLFGDLTGDDLSALVTFATRYAASVDGTFADARPFGPLRLKAIARIPG